jgi:hypothetical protein
MPWIKWDTRGLQDAKIVDLSDGAFRLWIATLSEAWHQKPKGQFLSERHYRACVSGVADAKHLRALVHLGLIQVNSDGILRVSNWDKHQIDPTASARKERYRNAIGTGLERNRNALDIDRDKTKTNNISISNGKVESLQEIMRKRQ